ncbi:hypothetical protein [Metaplanococcus flavidus]|uniref:Type 4 fimbrial biogenesis protein PilX N-terminal domain-containing protein n=1 Tax=Metaplanococcus flavidus TaxID=569883 RepID=A0ABW3LA67_9BACL
MKFMRNENGYALLMVIMLVLLFTTLGMGLLAMNINASKQFNKKEDQVQARHQAEMGVLHYNVILKDKVESSSNSAISCSDIDELLGNDKKLAVGKYTIEPLNLNDSTCKVIESGKKLQITIKSKGRINGDTEKEVEATFYVDNLGEYSEEEQENEDEVRPPLNEPANAEMKYSHYVDKHSNDNDSTINTSLIIDTTLSTGNGSSTDFKVKKHLYIKGTNSKSLDLNNHTCIGVGGNFTALNNIDWGGQSSIELVVQKDAYFPSNIINWKGNKTQVYIFGNLFLPKNYTYKTHNNKNATLGDMDVYIGGKVYQHANGSVYKEITTHPFYLMNSELASKANNLGCAVPRIIEKKESIPKWILQDDKNIDYQPAD